MQRVGDTLDFPHHFSEVSASAVLAQVFLVVKGGETAAGCEGANVDMTIRL
jgi:hypothetical protein